MSDNCIVETRGAVLRILCVQIRGWAKASKQPGTSGYKADKAHHKNEKSTS